MDVETGAPVAESDKIVEVPVRDPLYVEVHCIGRNGEAGSADDVNTLLSDSECPQRGFMLQLERRRTRTTPAWTIGVRELRNGEDALCMLFCLLLLIDRFYEAEIILFRRNLMATRLELTCWTMLVEDYRRTCSASLLRSKLSNI